MAGADNLAINTMAISENAVTVPLNFEASMSGQYTINVETLDFPASVTVQLRDNLNGGQLMDLRANPNVTFDANSGDSPSRFDILIGEGMSENKDVENDNYIEIYSNNKNIYINSMSDELNVSIFDISGKMLAQKQISTNGIITISVNYPAGIYFVKAVSSEGTYTEKVYIK